MDCATPLSADEKTAALATYIKGKITEYRTLHGYHPAIEFTALFSVGDDILAGKFSPAKESR
jgi:hypothetical protein